MIGTGAEGGGPGCSCSLGRAQLPQSDRSRDVSSCVGRQLFEVVVNRPPLLRRPTTIAAKEVTTSSAVVKSFSVDHLFRCTD